MSYENQEKVPQIMNPNSYQLVRPVFHHVAGPSVPFYAMPQSEPLFPVKFLSHQKPLINPNVSGTSINNDNFGNYRGPAVVRKASPLKNVIPAKRHRLNETNSSGEYDSMISDSSYSTASSEEFNGLEMDSVFYELQCTASKGSAFAENIAKGYRKRPCFKKIELLLSRLRQELNFKHNIVSNINSQGTAWVIKDLIFVFARIINAWVIVRGYFYDKSKDLDELRKDFDPNLVEFFENWQESTLKLVKSMMATVENLDVISQNKSGNKQKKREFFADVDLEVKQYEKSFLDEFQKGLFEPKVLDNSETIQVQNHHNRSYFRAGVLKPLRLGPVDSSLSTSSSLSSPLTPNTPDSDFINWMSYEDLNDSGFKLPKQTSTSERLYNRKTISLPVTPLDGINPFDNLDKSRARKDLSATFCAMPGYIRDIETELEKQFCELDMKTDEVAEEELKNKSSDDDLLLKMYKEDGRKVVYLMKEIAKVSVCDSFAVSVDIIKGNVKNGRYINLNNILDEFKILIKYAKGMVEKSKENDENGCVQKFLTSLEAVINRKAFE